MADVQHVRLLKQQQVAEGATRLARGAAPALEKPHLNHNQIGDEGVRHLRNPARRGARAQDASLHRNSASDAAQQGMIVAPKKNRKERAALARGEGAHGA